MEETEYWHDMELYQRLALIGKPVTVGLYEKDDEEFNGSVTGTLTSVTEADTRVVFNFVGEQIAQYDSLETVALVTWLADDR